MRADLAHPHPERISPARAFLDSGIAAHERRRREDATARRVGNALIRQARAAQASAAAARPPVDTRVPFADRLRLERQGLGLDKITAAVARAASGDRSPRPNLAERVRAGRTGGPDARRVREALDRTAEELRQREGEDAPVRKGRLSIAELERLARGYAGRYGCPLEVARRAVEGGAR